MLGSTMPPAALPGSPHSAANVQGKDAREEAAETEAVIAPTLAASPPGPLTCFIASCFVFVFVPGYSIKVHEF